MNSGAVQSRCLFGLCYRRIQKVTKTWPQVLSLYWSKWWEESYRLILTITVFQHRGCKFSSLEYSLCLGKMTRGNYSSYQLRDWIVKLFCSSAHLFFHSTSEIMYEVLDESLQRAEMNHNITYGTCLVLCYLMWRNFCSSCWFYSFFFLSPSAILYECVKCIYTVYPKSELLEKAAKCIGNFILSPKINLKYLGKK